jgi:hypothetical protein
MRTYNPDLSAYYNVVEEGVIRLLGGHEKAGVYFEKNRGDLSFLWEFTKRKFNQGWTTRKTIRVWYGVYAYKHFGMDTDGAIAKQAKVNYLAGQRCEALPAVVPVADEQLDPDKPNTAYRYVYRYTYRDQSKKSGWKHLPVMV